MSTFQLPSPPCQDPEDGAQMSCLVIGDGRKHRDPFRRADQSRPSVEELQGVRRGLLLQVGMVVEKRLRLLKHGRRPGDGCASQERELIGRRSKVHEGLDSGPVSQARAIHRNGIHGTTNTMKSG
jgi:hypothetical protein